MNTNYTSKIDPDNTIQGLKTWTLKFKDLSEKIRNSQRYASYAIKVDSKNALYLWDDLKNNIHLIKVALEINPKLYNQIVPEFMKNNINAICEFVKVAPWIVENLDERFRENQIFMEKLINTNSLVFWYIWNGLKNNKNFIISLIKNNHNIYFELWLNDLAFDNDIIEAYKQSEEKDKKIENKFEIEEQYSF